MMMSPARPSLLVREFPILLLRLLGPIPEAALPDARRLLRPEILVEVERVGTGAFDHKPQLVLVMCNGLVTEDLRRKVRRRNFRLTHGHVAHLRPLEVDAVAGRV